MITQRYQYAALTRESVNGQRLYATPDGQKLPSVTTILDRTKPAEKRLALENWKRRVGHDKAQQITTEAANRGTRMHNYLEHYVKTGEHKDRPSNPFAWASHAMAETVTSHHDECVATSTAVQWGVRWGGASPLSIVKPTPWLSLA